MVRAFEFKNRWALVTGASSGLGREFARQVAGQGAHLILTARSVERLEELARDLEDEHAVRTHVIPADLSRPNEVTSLIERIREAELQVDVLINNAGLGSVARIPEADPVRILQIVDVNIRALTQLSYEFLPEMLKREEGAILNVGSIVSFQPVTYMGVYAASKAYVLHLSEALSAEISGSNVRVVALCPGTTRTGFFDSAGAKGWFDRFKPLTPEFVVDRGLQAIRGNRQLSVPGLKYQLMTFMPRLLPRKLSLAISKKLFQQTLSEQ